MFQKEMAERIISQPGSKNFGIISVLTQAYYTGEWLFEVDKSSFNPPPKVQSAVIRLERKPALTLDCSESLFKSVVKQAFNQRRKMLRNSLKSLFPTADILADPFDYISLTKQIEAASLDASV
jgi:16S rRNA (adenine1518-N6/adenine1519-N6)-dimethyltransferase